MATIRKRNGRWQAQIRKSGTRAISRTFTLRQDALFWAREQERVLELQTDVFQKKTLLKKTLADLLHDYEVEVGQRCFRRALCKTLTGFVPTKKTD